MKSGRYAEGQRNRQAALDYINRNQGAKGPDIFSALGWDKVTGATRLAKMTVNGELSREKCVYQGVNVFGQPYAMTTYAYTARVKRTRGADEVAASIAANLRAEGDRTREKSARKVKAKPKWLTRNTDPDRPAIPRQGGQGASSPRRCIAMLGE